MLPFLCVGFWCLIGAFGILFTIPTINKSDINNDSTDGKKLTILGLLKVRRFFSILSIYFKMNNKTKKEIITVLKTTINFWLALQTSIFPQLRIVF